MGHLSLGRAEHECLCGSEAGWVRKLTRRREEKVSPLYWALVRLQLKSWGSVLGPSQQGGWSMTREGNGAGQRAGAPGTA